MTLSSSYIYPHQDRHLLTPRDQRRFSAVKRKEMLAEMAWPKMSSLGVLGLLEHHR